ncbi:MAG TPA: OsmC family protein [Chloroflexota bacterium]|nr:OsmC family protein [Chloroflexota bacterium]
MAAALTAAGLVPLALAAPADFAYNFPGYDAIKPIYGVTIWKALYDTGLEPLAMRYRKMRQDVTGYRIHVRGERRARHPMIITSIAVEHEVSGRSLNPEAVRRAVDLSVHRYCSVSAMLEGAVGLAVTYRVVDEASGAVATGSVTAGTGRNGESPGGA